MSETFFDILDAVPRLPEAPLVDFVLAGSLFRVSASTGSLSRRLTAALRHRLVPVAPEGVAPHVTIFAWEGPPSPLARAERAWDLAERWDRREPVHASYGNGMFYFDPVAGMVSLLDRGKGRAGVWFCDAATLPVWISAAPFLRILDGWFTPLGRMLCHGAAVAKYGVAALVLGPGGAGKSTLALRSLGAGFSYLGDDYVLLEPGERRAVVHSVYGSGKFTAEDLAAGLPRGTAVVQRPLDPAGKSFLSVPDSSMADSAPLAAVFVPCFARAARPRLEPISRAEALRSVLPSALRQLPADEGEKLRILSRTLTAPCYRLHLSSDPASNLGAVDDELAARSREGGFPA